MEIRASARKHGIADADIEHAFRNAVHFGFHTDAEETRLLVVGPDRSGRLLEIVAVPADAPERIIHADYLRRTFHNRVR